MIDMTTAQRDTLERKYTEQAHDPARPATLDAFLDTVKPTSFCDDAVTVNLFGSFWLCIERDGYAHS